MTLFSKYFEVGGRTLHLLHPGGSTLPGVPPEGSRGKRLVFLHPAGLDGGVWHRQLRHFDSRHSPIAFDLPSHGRSAGTEALESIGAAADVTLALLDRLTVDRAVLVGSGVGCAIALEAALRAPARIEALVLAAAAARLEIPANTIETWRLVTMGRSPQPFDPFGFAEGTAVEILREHFGHQVTTDPRVRYGDLVAANGADFTARLGEIRCPVLVVSGSRDPLTPPESGAALAASLPRARHVVLDGAGHYLYVERPDQLAAAIEAFLEELP
ncbi:MAG: alpha/beta fold hydrolase [Candidatus Binatia bacterium]